MKKRIYILSALVLTLSLWAAALWLHHDRRSDIASETRYGVGEGMELVEQTTTHGDKRYVVEDADGSTLFRIPLRGCLLDTRFRDGRLCFREMATGREGVCRRPRHGGVHHRSIGEGARGVIDISDFNLE